MRKPWFELNPEWLKEEKRAFAQKGFDLRLNEEILLLKKVAVFEGEVHAKDGVHRLRVIYPSGYPEIGPEVLDLSRCYHRHQNPYQRNFCLPNWKFTLRGSDRVQDALDLINLFHENPQRITEKEIDAPEPASTWYPYGNSKTIIIPSIMTGFPKQSRGNFTIRLLPFFQFPQIIQALIVKVSEKDSSRSIELGDAGPLNTGTELHGLWLRSDVHPPYDIKNFDDFKKWVSGLYGKTKAKYYIEKNKKAGQRAFKKNALKFEHELLGVVYPEEGPGRNEYHDQWLVGMFVKYQGRCTKTFLRPSLLGIKDLYFQRIPSLKKLGEKSVVILGLGAIGSVIAIELARAGIKQFFLIDGDFYDVGNVVRQAGDLRLTGLAKVESTAVQIKFINPFAKVDRWAQSLGKVCFEPEAVEDGKGDDLSLFAEIVEKHDIVISAIGDSSVEYMVNEILVESGKPGIFASILNGAWGGQIFRAIPGKACFQCFGYHKQDNTTGEVSYDIDEQPLYVRGCGFPTFTGTGFDSGIIANLATRFAVQTLLTGGEDAYPDATYNLINWNNRSDGLSGLPSIENKNLPIHTSCSLHKKNPKIIAKICRIKVFLRNLPPFPSPLTASLLLRDKSFPL